MRTGGNGFAAVVGMLVLGASVQVAGAAEMACAVGNQYSQDRTFVLVRADVPLYPELAQIARVTGRVRMCVQITDGEVTRAECDPSAHGLLCESAKANAATWRFQQPSRGLLSVEFVYDLTGEPAERRENPRIEWDIPSSVKITVRRWSPVVVEGAR